MLLERALELEVLHTAVTRLAGGAGGIVVLAAPAGLGKTALLEHAVLEAAEAGCRVRRAAPGPLERHFGFGVVRALLEAPLRDASDEQRARLLEGAAAPAGALLLDGAVPDGDATMAIAHSVLWLCSALADDAPLALVIDDAHWADRRSLEVLAYLARRIADLPLLITVGARADDPDAAAGPAQPDRRSPRGDRAAPPAAEPRGAAQLIRRAAPRHAVRVCRDCHRAAAAATRGCWASSAARSPTTARRVDASEGDAPPMTRSRAPSSAGAWPSSRRATARVVEALAVIGDGAPRQVVAAVAGVALDELGAGPRRAAGRRAARPRAARASRTT